MELPYQQLEQEHYMIWSHNNHRKEVINLKSIRGKWEGTGDRGHWKVWGEEREGENNIIVY